MAYDEDLDMDKEFLKAKTLESDLTKAVNAEIAKYEYDFKLNCNKELVILLTQLICRAYSGVICALMQTDHPVSPEHSIDGVQYSINLYKNDLVVCKKEARPKNLNIEDVTLNLP